MPFHLTSGLAPRGRSVPPQVNGSVGRKRWAPLTATGIRPSIGTPSLALGPILRDHGLTDLGVRARLKATLDISLGLVVALWVTAHGVSFADITEVVMNSASAFMACVWCGAAFLRSPGWVSSNPSERCGRC